MHRLPTIKTISAAVMLLLFALSITPRQFLHVTIAGHKHSYSKVDGDVNLQSSKKNFQCNWQDQVVESPFDEEPAFKCHFILASFSAYTDRYTSYNYSSEIFFSSLRGPPSV